MPFDQVGYQPETVVQDEVLRCLIEARKLIENERNWLKGTYWVGDQYCAHGALSVAANSAGFSWIGARDFLRPFAAPHYNAMALNDAHSTTHADVLALFDRAISARRAELVKP